MRSYETVVIWAPSLSESEQETENGRVIEIIRESGSEYKGIDVWGRRQLAYPIKKQSGHLLFFSAGRRDENHRGPRQDASDQ